MKKLFKNCFCLLAILVMCITLTACGSGSANVKYDLTNDDTFASAVVTQISNNPNKYNGETIKVRGKLQGSSSYYTLNEIAECCNWSFEVKLDNINKTLKSGKNYTMIGKCKSKKTNSKTSWYLEAIEIV